ncbi:MAG: tRNA pseudouridine(54/55) synthase Pus10 [Thermoplasmata archaeon]|nr:tRNA pseudouridine(54/55) synthase Pus10 [Thermoplasmata archaeon]
MEVGSPELAPFELSPELLASVGRLRGTPLCPECLGRVYGRWGHGLTNPERAERLQAHVEGLTRAAPTDCFLCAGAFDRWPTWIRRAQEASSLYEWRRFTCGSRWDPELLAREEALWGIAASAWGESARAAFNREWGKRLSEATGTEGTTTDADLLFVADLPVGRVELTIAPLYVEGRYRKLDRTLPQTRWPCRRCRGRGCASCSGSGKMYPTSVEELIAEPFLAATGAEGTRFHGMGREDIDARMLGRGRPFVLELRAPRRRTLDLPALAAELARTAAGRVEVDGLAPSDAHRVLQVKEASPWKSYRVTFTGEADVEKVKEALRLVPLRAIAQRTPTRVAHRRADRVRTRKIAEVAVVAAEPGRFTLDLRAEAGTYIKEWVEGDAGRTEPSLAQLLGVRLSVEALDVLEIHDSTEE